MRFIDALLLLFIGLKLTDYIDWSWWLVFSPLMFTFTIYGIGLLLVNGQNKRGK